MDSIIALGLILVCCGLWFLPRKKHKYLVTYEADLQSGGWTHSEVTVTVEKLNAEELDKVRDFVRTDRPEIMHAVCIMSVVRLDE